MRKFTKLLSPVLAIILISGSIQPVYAFENLSAASINGDMGTGRGEVKKDIAKKIFPNAIGNGEALLGLVSELPPRIPGADNGHPHGHYIDLIFRSRKMVHEALDLAIKKHLENRYLIEAPYIEQAEQTLRNMFDLQSNLTKKLHLFRAIRRSKEDYLLGFRRDGVVGLSPELIHKLYRIDPLLLAQYVYNESIPERGIKPDQSTIKDEDIDRSAHRTAIMKLHGPVFGEDKVIELRGYLRRFIDLRVGGGELAEALLRRDLIDGYKNAPGKYKENMERLLYIADTTEAPFVEAVIRVKLAEIELDRGDQDRVNLKRILMMIENINNIKMQAVIRAKMLEFYKKFPKRSPRSFARTAARLVGSSTYEKNADVIIAKLLKVFDIYDTSEDGKKSAGNEVWKSIFEDGLKEIQKEEEDKSKIDLVKVLRLINSIPDDEIKKALKDDMEEIHKNFSLHVMTMEDMERSTENNNLLILSDLAEDSLNPAAQAIAVAALARYYRSDNMEKVKVWKPEQYHNYEKYRDKLSELAHSETGSMAQAIAAVDYEEIYIDDLMPTLSGDDNSVQEMIDATAGDADYPGPAIHEIINNSKNPAARIIASIKTYNEGFMNWAGDDKKVNDLFKIAGKNSFSKLYGEGTRIQNDKAPDRLNAAEIKYRAELFKYSLIKKLKEDPEQSFILALDSDIGKDLETIERAGIFSDKEDIDIDLDQHDIITAIYNAVDRLERMRDKNGDLLFPNLHIVRGSGQRGGLMADVYELLEDTDNKVSLNNIFLIGKQKNIKNGEFSELEGDAWITGIDDGKAGTGVYLPVFEAITLTIMASLGADLQSMKRFYDKISDNNITLSEFKKMLDVRLISILPKATKIKREELRELYKSVRRIYLAA